jgi:dTDP-4-amino-4,6-dideoxygalactose transaminase
MSDFIPFSRPYIPESGVVHFHQALAAGHHAGDGPYTAHCSALLTRGMGVGKTLLTPSCTAALEMCALLLDLHPGDEVIFPAFTFVSTVNAFVLRGIRPVFCDSCVDSVNLDVTRIERLITPRTKALVVVHYAGISCQMEPIQALCVSFGLALVEDLAHGPFASYRGRPLGTFGTFATLSFHHTKNFSCGEGGALLINNPDFFEKAEIMREKGTNRAQFFRGEVDKYTWVAPGSSFLLADLLAGLLLGGLEERERIQNERLVIWSHYADNLAEVCAETGVALPRVPSDTTHSAHLFHLVFESLERRQGFIAYMKGRGIQCPFHYQSLPDTPMGQSWGEPVDPCLIARALSDRLVRLPLWNGLTSAQLERITDAAADFIRG